jgi:ribosomal protein L37AE/L43A
MENIIVATTNQTCEFCGGNEVEQLGDNHFNCKNCGVGFRNGIEGSPDLKKHLKFLKSAIMMAKVLNPQMNNQELSHFVQKHLHNVENHPLDKHDFCIYCNISYKQ